ncbi:MAG TPA: two-component regulator propeller domain-containing protein [Vicinamibacterales bacterium]|nr:two-component regulator propeller domain-containing protein [Vicinamibacterales bacterium]
MNGLHLVVERLTAAVLVCLTSAASSLAATQTLDVSQFAHAAWTVGDGFAKGAIYSIAQTPDGYLWLGTEFGLLRFDGVTTTPWPPDQPIANEVPSLIAARDGTLWIGMAGGVASWKDGHLTRYAELSGRRPLSLLEDRTGTVWVMSPIPGRRLCAIRNGGVECMTEKMSRFGRRITTMYEDRKGNLWFAESTGLWQWNQGQPTFYPLGNDLNVQALSEDADGALVVVQAGRIDRLVGGKLQEAYSLPSTFGLALTNRVLCDRDGGIWIGSLGGGLAHAHDGRVDQFSRSDGLTSDSVAGFLQDREGNIWVGTHGGLDRFRATVGAQFTARQGFSNLQVTAVLASKKGSIWVRTLDGLDRWENGRVTVFHDFPDLAGRTTASETAQVIGASAYGNGLVRGGGSLFEDERGRIWVSGPTVEYIDHGRFVAVSGVPDGPVFAMTGDLKGNIWLAHGPAGLLRVSAERVVERIPWERLGHTDYARALTIDPFTGSLSLGFFDGGVETLKDGQVSVAYGAKEGLAKGRVNDLRFGHDGALWVATTAGSSRLKNGRVTTLSSRDGLPCDAVHWTIEDDSGDLWLSMRCGLVRIARSDFERWEHVAEVNDARPGPIPISVFDNSDGVRLRFYEGPFSPRVAKGADGRLWFFPLEGLIAVDPLHLSRNTLSPLVHIEQFDADHHPFPVSQAGAVRLPPRSRDIEIDYTGLSFASPQDIRFRHRLDGRDREWQEAGTRRQVFYSDLPPGSYRFHVTASNKDGVWNDTGTSIDFVVAAAYYQTAWFRAMVVVAGLGMLWALHRIRLRRLAHEFDGRLQERVTERTRIARELHDTLLQSFQGLMLRLQVVDDLLPHGKAKHQLEEALERADQAIAEGRNAVYDLRGSAAATNDLAEAVRALGEELVTQASAGFHLVVEGPARDLNPILRDEVYRITREALRNAFTDAGARNIETEIVYGERIFRMRIRDDGDGIQPETLKGGRVGHYGLQGMRERAKQVGGTLDIWSRPGAGTEIDLSIAAAIAYGPSTNRRWLGLFQKRAG